jgi:hypothetical protein
MSPRIPMIGRNTKGGLVRMSSPLMPPPPPPVRGPEACWVSLGEGEGDSEGEGPVVGVGVGVTWRVKVACGLGWTLVQSVCLPGLAPANSFTTFVKAPLSSVTRVPAGWLGVSQ